MMKKILLTICFSFLLLIYPASHPNALADNSLTSDPLDPNTPVIVPGCEFIETIDPNMRSYTDRRFENPETIESANGLLEAEFDVRYAQNMIADCPVNLRSYNGKLVGPTLRVKPGDKIKIKLTNSLPPEPTGEVKSATIEVTDDQCIHQEMRGMVNNTPHNFNTTNFHTHGLHVYPGGCSDNVLRVMSPKTIEGEPAPEYAIEVDVPADHPSGTFWYHAHLHGSTALQVSSGMEGALIIEGGGLDLIPEIAEAQEKIFMFQQIAYDQKGEIEDYVNFGPGAWGNTGRHITINGQIIPVINMQPGEVQRWRFIHGGIRESIYLELRDGYSQQIPLHEIAIDGISLGKLDSWKSAPLEIEPGYRSDVLVKAKLLSPRQQFQEYFLIDKPTSAEKSLLGRAEMGHILAKVIVSGEPLNMSLPSDTQIAEAKQNDAPADILDSEITQPSEEVIFSVNSGNPVTFTVNGQSFDPDNVRTLELNKAQIWNLSTDPQSLAPSHPFHIHVNPFQFDRKDPEGNTERIWRDTLLVNQGSNLQVRSRYIKFLGKFVLHCHILDHEDQGMMQVVEITN